jgi:hypothetical protein
MRTRSQVDFWISLIIWLTVLIIAISMLIVPKQLLIYSIVIGLICIIFLLWIYFGTYYEFKKDYLYCKSGPFFERIYYNKIKSIKLSNNMLASMALSAKRIEIKQHSKNYFTGTTLISPKNREIFMNELISRCKFLD